MHVCVCMYVWGLVVKWFGSWAHDPWAGVDLGFRKGGFQNVLYVSFCSVYNFVHVYQISYFLRKMHDPLPYLAAALCGKSLLHCYK